MCEQIKAQGIIRRNQLVKLLVITVLLAPIVIVGCSDTDISTGTANITQETFGYMEDGTEVFLFTLSNSNNIQAQITNYGGIITSLHVPDRDGNVENIVLGFDKLDDYLSDHPYFGALIGRYGNRIEQGRFDLDGMQYELSINDGENHLHGGERGFDKRVWDTEIVDNQILKLTYMSPDGEMGYPGNLQVTASYTLTQNNELKIEFEATTDQATPVNLTAHSYFNLTGDASISILDHQLKINATEYTPVNDQLIPTGEIRLVENTPFDFTDFESIGFRIDQVEGGYDHNYVLTGNYGELRLASELLDPESGRILRVYSDEPGIQFYSGNFLDGSLTNENGITLNKYAGLCLEPQHFPNSPNIAAFPSTILHPGEQYQSVIVYELDIQ